MDNSQVSEIYEAIRIRIAQGISYQMIETEFIDAGYTKEQIKLFYVEVSNQMKHNGVELGSNSFHGEPSHESKKRLRKLLVCIILFASMISILIIFLGIFLGSSVRVETSMNKIEAFIPEYLEKNNGSLANFCEDVIVVDALETIVQYTDNLACKANTGSVMIQYIHKDQQVLCMNTTVTFVTDEQLIPTEISCLNIPIELDEMKFMQDSLEEVETTLMPTNGFSEMSATTSDTVDIQVENEQIISQETETKPEVYISIEEATQIEVITKSMNIISPQSGDQFCIEDGIKIIWESTLEDIDYFGLGLNKPNSGLPIGQQLSYRDAVSSLQRYEYKWDFKDRSGAFIEPGYLYSISIAAFTRDGGSTERVFSDGRFTAITCY